MWAGHDTPGKIGVAGTVNNNYNYVNMTIEEPRLGNSLGLGRAAASVRIMINMSEYETDDPLFQGRHRETERKAFGDGLSSGSGGGARQESTEQVRGQLQKISTPGTLSGVKYRP